MGEEIAVAFGADAGFAMQLSTAIRSLGTSNPHSRLRVFILHDGLDDEMRSRIEKATSANMDIEWLQVPVDQLKHAQLHERLSVAALFRLALPDLLPADVERVIYLDSDLVVAEPLEEMWRAPLGESIVAAVRDAVIPWVAAPKGLPWRDLDLDPTTPYFNSGVMVIPLDRWRAEGIGARAAELVVERRFNNCDQCALNAVIAGRWRALEPRWNVQGGHFADEECLAWVVEQGDAMQRALAYPAIVHFNYSWRGRPWLPSCSHPLQNLWFESLDRTAWAGWRPKQPSRSIGARVARRLGHQLLTFASRPRLDRRSGDRARG